MSERNDKCKELVRLMRKEGCSQFGDIVGKYYMTVKIRKIKKKCPTCGNELEHQFV